MVADILCVACINATNILFNCLVVSCKNDIEYERYDGWFNNLANPSWGTVGKYEGYVNMTLVCRTVSVFLLAAKLNYEGRSST